MNLQTAGRLSFSIVAAKNNGKKMLILECQQRVKTLSFEFLQEIVTYTLYYKSSNHIPMGKEGDQFDSHDHSLKDPTRILALTDGVFAIIMTLLVLELKVPSVQKDVELSSHLLGLGYHLLLYFASFLLAGVYWVGHRLIFSLVKYVNTTLVWLNIFFLMICSLIPFAAALLGNYPFETYSLAIYGALLFLLAGFRLYMYLYVTQHHSLLYAPVPHIRRRRVIGVMVFAPVMFLLSLCIVPFFPKLALVLYCITPPMFVTAITLVNKMKIK